MAVTRSSMRMLSTAITKTRFKKCALLSINSVPDDGVKVSDAERFCDDLMLKGHHVAVRIMREPCF
jgi:hypothetical protein